MKDNDAPVVWPVWVDPRDTFGRIYKEEYYTLLHIKNTSSWPCGFREKDFLCLSHCKSMGANDPMVGPFLSQGTCFTGFM